MMNVKSVKLTQTVRQPPFCSFKHSVTPAVVDQSLALSAACCWAGGVELSHGRASPRTDCSVEKES